LKEPDGKERLLNLGRAYDTLSSIYTRIPYHLFSSYAFPPLHLLVELTYRCNLRCEMCQFLNMLRSNELQRNVKNEISADEIKRFVRSFPRTSVVTLTGGEPLLRNDFFKIVESLSRRNKIHIITNGTLLTEETAAFLCEHRVRSLLRGGVLALGVSIQGPPEIHDAITGMRGACESALKGIRFLNDLKRERRTPFPHIHITSVITERNAPHLSRIYELARDLGIDYCNFTLFNTSDFTSRLDLEASTPPDAASRTRVAIDPELLRDQLSLMSGAARRSGTALRFSPFGITAEEIVRYYRGGADLSHFHCTAPWRLLGISAYGDVTSCPFIFLGNIRKDNCRKLWNGPKQRQFRKRLKERGIFPICEGCCQSVYDH